MIQHINAAGLELIKRYEGFRAYPYQDANGLWTQGYGHTGATSADSPPLTPDQAEQLLKADVEWAEKAVLSMVSVRLTDNQFSALVSLVYNIGSGTFQWSPLRALVNKPDFPAAADEFLRYNHAGGKVLAGLTARRADERALFLQPDATQGQGEVI